MTRYTQQELDVVKSIREKIYKDCEIQNCSKCPFGKSSRCSRILLDYLREYIEDN